MQPKFIGHLKPGEQFYLTPKMKGIGAYLTFHECKDFGPRTSELLLFVKEGMLDDEMTNFRIVVNRFLEVEPIDYDYEEVTTDGLIQLLDEARNADDWEGVRDLSVLLMARKDKDK